MSLRFLPIFAPGNQNGPGSWFSGGFCVVMLRAKSPALFDKAENNENMKILKDGNIESYSSS